MSDPSPKRFQIGWQVYIARGFVGHWTQADEYRDLVRYEAPCADPRCRGRLFEAVTSKSCWRQHVVNRRCRQHRNPGSWVDNKKPPVPVAALPPAFRPRVEKIEPIARRRRYGTLGKPRNVNPAPPAASRKRVGSRRQSRTAKKAAQAAPRPSYLD